MAAVIKQKTSGSLRDETAPICFSHIERDVHPDYVYQYGVKTRGYRAKEYNDAMNAVGDYL